MIEKVTNLGIGKGRGGLRWKVGGLVEVRVGAADKNTSDPNKLELTKKKCA